MYVTDLTHVVSLHHAYIVVGDGGAAEVLAMLEKRGVETRGNADVLAMQFQDLAVDDARTITQYAFLKSVSDSKYFIVSFNRINDAAQNALLKVIEEGPGNTVFFFCTESEGGLLPTLKSRCIILATHATAKVAGVAVVAIQEAEEFFKLRYADRIAKVEKILATLQRTEDRGPARAFMRALVEAGYTAHLPPKAKRTLLTANSYMALTGASVKALLLHIAVTLPIK